MIELIRLDLEWRYKSGEAARIESYLARYPDLGQGETLLELVSLEYELRNRRDPGLTVDEFLTRFPAITDEVNKQQTPPADARPKDPDWIRSGAEPVAGYRLVKFLGRGGFGQVWEAAGPSDVKVAFKFVCLKGSRGARKFRR